VADAGQPLERWLSCDWGTTNFRLRLLAGPAATVLAEVQTSGGVRQVAGTATGCAREAAFADYLAERLAELRRQAAFDPALVPLAISGMASSALGWRELPYAATPQPLDGSGLTLAAVGGLGRTWLISGVRHGDDVMRGEETELLGLLSQPAWQRWATDSVVLLPGTHSKHVRVQQGRLVGFRTYMTGELFEAISRHTILSHAVSERHELAPGSAELEAFTAAVHDAADGLTHALFTLRTNRLFDRCTPSANRARLSGLLIGAELHDLARLHPTAPLLLAAGAHQAPGYQAAAAALGLAPRLAVVPPAVVALAASHGHALLLQRLTLRG
jgi:2-dehydro-3-deoxygalactonokinase